MAELQFAIIGTGFWAQFQIGAWKELTGARLVAVCDRDRARAEALARRFGIPRVYDDAEQLIDSEKLDFVDVAVGPEAHAALVLLAARHRVPVICQKPMALDFPSCQQMVDACREAGIPFLIHENYRWQEPMRRIRRVLDSGRIGRPCRAHIQFSHGDIRLFDNQPYLFTQPHFAMFDMARTCSICSDSSLENPGVSIATNSTSTRVSKGRTSFQRYHLRTAQLPL